MTDLQPTVLLVHGAFADASDWDGVLDRLQQEGTSVTAAANPLRGLQSDSEYLRSVIDALPGPVVLVGHSYGGAVITNAATGASNVKGLVYLAAFAPDKGETLGQFFDPTKFPGAELGPDTLVVRPYPGGLEATIDPGRFHSIFAADLPQEKTALMAARQRPVAMSVFDDVTGDPAWRTIPSWYQI
jgi:pimeloyl-ACP methyl ester carboxylesterase